MSIDYGKDIGRVIATLAENGHEKKAGSAIQDFIRDEVREGGVLRSKLIPAQDLGDDDLDKTEDPKELIKFMDVEPTSKATAIPFRGMPDTAIIEGKRVKVPFGKITSKKHLVNILELKTYSYDIRSVLQDQDVKNLQTEEDRHFINKIDAICDANVGTQSFVLHGGLTKVNYADAQKQFFTKRPLRHALMNVNTAKEFLKWDYDRDMGGGVYGSEAFAKGAPSVVHGIDTITTIKDEIVKDNFVYFFSKPEFIGKFYVLQPPTTVLKSDGEFISFYTYEVVGAGLGNTESFIRCEFKP